MIAKKTLMKQVQDLIQSPTFKVYEEQAKVDEYTRTNAAPHITITAPNTGKQYTYVVQLSQDHKMVKVTQEDLGLSYEIGFFPLSDFGPKKETKKTTKRTTRRVSTKRNTTSKEK